MSRWRNEIRLPDIENDGSDSAAVELCKALAPKIDSIIFAEEKKGVVSQDLLNDLKAVVSAIETIKNGIEAKKDPNNPLEDFATDTWGEALEYVLNELYDISDVEVLPKWRFIWIAPEDE